MNYIDDCAGAGDFQVLEERSGMSAVRIRGVDTFG